MPRSDSKITKFLIEGVRCVIVTNDEYTTAYLNIEDAPDILFVPVSYRGDLPEVLEGKVIDKGKWTGWDYPEEIPLSVDHILSHMLCVILEAKRSQIQ